MDQRLSYDYAVNTTQHYYYDFAILDVIAVSLCAPDHDTIDKTFSCTSDGRWNYYFQNFEIAFP